MQDYVNRSVGEDNELRRLRKSGKDTVGHVRAAPKCGTHLRIEWKLDYP